MFYKHMPFFVQKRNLRTYHFTTLLNSKSVVKNLNLDLKELRRILLSSNLT